MATSNSYTFSVSRDDIVREALLNLKKIDGYDPIDATIMADCTRKLNLLVKQWMGKTDFAPGLKVWTRKRGHLFLHNTQGQYPVSSSYVGWADNYVQNYTTGALAAGATVVPLQFTNGISLNDKLGIELDSGDLFWSTVSAIGTGNVTIAAALPSASASSNIVFTYTNIPQPPLQVEAAVLRDNQYNDTPLKIMQSKDYDLLPNKVSPTNYGDPTAIYVENQLGYVNIYTDVAGSSDVSKHIVLTYMEAVQDFINNTDTPYYPQEWYRALCWGLTKECGPMFNAAWTPVMEDLFKTSLAIAQQKDPEVETLYFQPGQD